MNNPHKIVCTCLYSREQIVLRYGNGQPVTSIASAFGISVRTVFKWLKRHRDHGHDGLHNTHGEWNMFGRVPVLLTTRQCTIAIVILAVVLALPQEVRAQAKGKVSYLILGGTVEPLMVTKPDDPMAGGIITEVMKHIFDKSGYQIVPRVMPWKRMVEELRTGDNWITYGFPEGNEPGIPLEFSESPVMEFNHVAITLKSNHFKIKHVSDVVDRVAILVENFHYPGLDQHLDKPLVGKGGGAIKTVRAFSPKGTLRMLQHKRGDVVFGFHARMLYNLRETGLPSHEFRFQDASRIIPSQPLYLTMSSQQPPEVKLLINDGLKRLSADGTLKRILQKYSGPEGLVE